MTADARTSLVRGGGLIAPALTLVNVCAYAVTVAAARRLPADDYGVLVALLGVLLVACVPAIALQAVVARTLVAGSAAPGALLRRCLVLGAIATVAAAALAPVVAVFLHSGRTGPLLVAAQLWPFALLSGAMGVLQGAERFGALSLVIVVQAVGRGVALVPLLLSGSSDDVLVALLVGTTGTAAFALALVGAPARGPAFAVADVWHATGGLLALLLLANLDVLLARNVLPGDESGRYAVGAVLSKAAFWLPQAVAVVVFPRLGDAAEGRVLLRRSVLAVGGLGVLEVVGCVLLARPVLQTTFGASYGSLSPYAWLWVVQGASLAVVQLLVYRAIALHDRVAGLLIGAGAAVEAAVVLLARPSRPSAVVAVATAVALSTTAVLLARLSARRRPRWGRPRR